ncbi:DinB family protein [Proteinivorax hydrogeniformans]|uniref:DinB family protein n=1 Tax=Proteinivorax hydrogeniformans TaxID=1826727 RepID=A0AAU8HVM8_9FIRM
MRKSVKGSVINTLLYARRDWDRLINSVDEVEIGKVGVRGEWSIKDLIAHVTWYEKEMEILIRTKKLDGSALWELSSKERDDVIYQKNKFKPLDELKKHSLKTFAYLLDALETADDADLLDPGQIEGMPKDWQPLDIIANNTWMHYTHHEKEIREFLDKNN